MVRPQDWANFIRLNSATSLRQVLCVVDTLMNSEICELAADSHLSIDDGADWLEEY